MVRRSSVLDGKVALVTGAGHGIGRIIAKVFAQEGASVVFSDIQQNAGETAAESARDLGLSALFFRADLRQEGDIKELIHFAGQKFGRLDIVVNNARPRLRQLSFVESLQEWDLAMDVLLKAPVLIAKYALPQMLKSGGGNFINIGSTNSTFVSQQPVAYHVAKAGIVQLTRYMAYQFGPQGIRVNAICPGLVDLYDENKPLTSDPLNKKATKLAVPLRRASYGEDIAEAALFLCTKSSAYITGQVLIVDGGLSLGDHFQIARNALSEGPLIVVGEDV